MQKDKFSYSLGYNHWSSDGFSEAKQPEGSTAEFDKDGYSQNNVQANFGYKANHQINIQPFIRYSNNNGDLDQDAFTDEKDFTYEAKNLQAGIKNSFRINNSQLNLIYQFQHIQRNYLDDSSSVNGFYIYNRSQYIAREHFAELIAVITFENFRITAGGDFRRSNTDFEAIQKNIYSQDITMPAYSGDSVQQDQKSLYASLNYNANSFNFEVGGRFNDHSAYGSNFAFNINPSYLINKKLKIYSNISSGYKVPSLYQLFSEYGNKELQPEVSMNIEAGVQYYLSDKRSAIRAGVFKREVKDVIAFFFDPVTFQSKYINQDKQNDKGFELDAKIFFGNKFTLTALYSFVDGEITTRQNGKDTTYFNLLRRPQSNLNLALGAQLTPKLYLSTQVNAVGNSQDVYFDPVTFQASSIELKNYFLLNFYAEYSILQQLKIFADFRNITDSDYSDIYGYNTAGLNAYGGFRLRL